MSKATSHQTIVGVEDNWETPPSLLQEAMKKYNIHPTLDVCATDSNTKFPNFITPEMNSLMRIWHMISL